MTSQKSVARYWFFAGLWLMIGIGQVVLHHPAFCFAAGCLFGYNVARAVLLTGRAQ